MGSSGNFRMIPISGGNTGIPSSTTVVSVGQGMSGLLYWGQPWAAAGNQETFSFFDPSDLNNDGQLFSGSRVLIRSLLNATDSSFIKSMDALGENSLRNMPLGPFQPFGGVADANWKSRMSSASGLWVRTRIPRKRVCRGFLGRVQGRCWQMNLSLRKFKHKVPTSLRRQLQLFLGPICRLDPLELVFYLHLS